ncbi:EAL domain-containing protein, partial [Escherichia coli]
LIRCVCGKKIGPDPRNFNQRVSLGRNDLLIRTFPRLMVYYFLHLQYIKAYYQWRSNCVCYD